MREFFLRPFLALVSAVDSASAPKNSARDMLNVLVEDGKVRPRYGYRNLQAPQAGFTAGWGFVHVHGYNASNVEVDEYLSFENLGAGVIAHARSGADAGSPAAITGATGLHASRWRAQAWRNVAYVFNRNETYPVAKHIIADATSWVPLKHPVAPTTALTYQLLYQATAGQPYAQMSWAGTDAGDLTVTGCAVTTSVSVDGQGNLFVRHSNSTAPTLSSVQIDLNGITAGKQDWYANDCFLFVLSPQTPAAFDIDPTSIRVKFINDDGSPVTFTPAETQVANLSPQHYAVRVRFTNKTRASWGNGSGTGKVRYVHFEYRVTRRSTGSIESNILLIQKPYIGCCYLYPMSDVPPFGTVKAGYSHRFSASDMDSPVGGVVEIPMPELQGVSPYPGLMLPGLGVWLKLSGTASGDANVDQVRFYIEDLGPNSQTLWKRLTTQSDASMDFTLKLDWMEVRALSNFAPGSFVFANVVGGFACRGWFTWLKKGGQDNVCHSAVGLPEQLASDLDPLDDDDAGATYSLASNFGDEPVGCGFQVDEAVIVPGYQGVYAQIGPRPLDLTPFRKLDGPGCVGPDAACRFKDSSGNQGVAYVDVNGEGVWFVRAFAGADPDQWPKSVELTMPIRGKIREFLVDAQASISPAPALSDCELVYDWALDSLVLTLGQRTLELKRRDLVTGKRGWHPNQFNLGGADVTVKAVSMSSERRHRWMRSDGRIDEVYWNSATSAFIGGLLRDGGNAMPSPYWRSQILAGFWRRWFHAKILRDNLLDLPSVQVFSSRQDGDAVAVEPGETLVQFDALQQGFDHEIQLSLPENCEPVVGLVIGESSRPISQRGL